MVATPSYSSAATSPYSATAYHTVLCWYMIESTLTWCWLNASIVIKIHKNRIKCNGWMIGWMIGWMTDWMDYLTSYAEMDSEELSSFLPLGYGLPSIVTIPLAHENPKYLKG